MRRSLLLSLMLSLLVALPALAQSGTDPVEPEAATSLDLPPAAPCRPPALCQPGQVISKTLQALSPADAREALLAVRLLSDLEVDLRASDDAQAELHFQLTQCRGDVAAGVGCPTVTARPPPTEWGTLVAWGAGGVVVGIVSGVALVLALGQ